ncbi:hypothetical protein R1T08_30065 [Streptomyces sp. SBC-4]|nr:hypothetical protein [Streptomyces sp. SBC-4]MDV5148300.1 hypothetical protein [Streptomyces sp. SBC-4]
MTVERALRWAVAAATSVAVVSAAGCGDERVVCTLKGAESQVHVVWDTAHFPLDATYRLCADEVCRDGQARQGGPLGTFDLPLPEATGELRVAVRFRVTDPADGRHLYDRTTQVTLRKVMPNGEHCGPVVWQAGLRADPERGLVDARPADTR